MLENTKIVVGKIDKAYDLNFKLLFQQMIQINK